MDRALQLYDAQAEGVQRFLESNGRFLLTYGTGCGKTPTAIRALAAWFGERTDLRILVVGPAIVRRHWCREFWRWSMLDAQPVEMGRTRKSGTKRQLEQRDLSYASRIQVVSYDLAKDVDAQGWDAIVFDEIHHLGEATSGQSRMARALVAANPKACVLGLSATLIPTDVRQLWHPLYLLFGAQWGRPSRTGGTSWQFAQRYCVIERNEYGSAIKGGRPEMLPELRERLGRVSHRLTRQDIVKDLPAIDVKVLDVPGQALARHLHAVGQLSRVRPEVAHVVEWFRAMPEDITHVVVLTYHRELARQVMEYLTPWLPDDASSDLIDGAMPSGERVERLERLSAAPRALLVATSESIREGIRLMWAGKVLFAEWRQSPAQVVQVLGRFQSVGDDRRPQVEILSDESLYEQARVLLERISAVNAVLKAGQAEAAIAEVFAPKELSQERMRELTLEMLKSNNTASAEWHDDDEGEEADGW